MNGREGDVELDRGYTGLYTLVLLEAVLLNNGIVNGLASQSVPYRPPTSPSQECFRTHIYKLTLFGQPLSHSEQ